VLPLEDPQWQECKVTCGLACGGILTFRAKSLAKSRKTRITSRLKIKPAFWRLMLLGFRAFLFSDNQINFFFFYFVLSILFILF
jgi:hypothetical protein